MDKQLVGKWYKEELGETLNIFDEIPLRMKMSFSSSGYYNFEPNCVYEHDGYFCFEINDDYYRMVYQIKYSDGNLEGFYTQHGKQTEVKYFKVSNNPEDLPFEVRPTEVYVPGAKLTRLELLKQYAGYDRNGGECENAFTLGGTIPEILNKYHYNDYINSLDNKSDEIVFRLLDFVCDHFGHNGTKGLSDGRTISDIVTFCESNDMKTNCRGLAILLASLLRLNCIKAQHITCMPYEEPFEDCHVVVDCLLPSGERVMLDPTSRLFYKDKYGKYVSLSRLRELLIAEEPIYENQTASYNGNGFAKDYNRDYMIKNTFRFARCTLNEDGVDGRKGNSRYIELVPFGYPTESFPESRIKDFVFNDVQFWAM